MNSLVIAIALSLMLLGNSMVAIDAAEFSDDSKYQRFYDLASELRCPKCQNQNIAESSSPIANDLRGEIHRMLSEGQSDEQIIDFMVARYGDFVLYDPRLNSRTVLLWLGPSALLLVGGVVVAVIIRGGRKVRSGTSNELSDAERYRLADLLQESDRLIEQDT